ncbi:MAG: prolipoprotein diacylglyceryl transferase [Naasia sp.]|jgi:prolipoprotein diacylglyceryl transferase|uniref:prolipoprotein diacylglyceryl transferase n=1 Tax=Naasia sp. TaxID=2546198 RepID=UPI0026291F54|nr:prolipoprotein diacylglyceryl transferase [Naasia sp.]MCU1569853.1 prolipoprotein diacylglyceryl transferase [Naasia sp.]
MPRSLPSPPPEWSSFTLGIFTIHTYALCILLGIVVALLLTSRRMTRRGAEPGVVVDIVLWAVPLGIVGARLYHVFTHPADYFGDGKDLLAILYIWEGGNAIFGGLIGGAVGAWIGCRLTGIRFWTFADALAPGLLFAQAIGRFGNWFNQELYGQPTDLPWGLEIPSTNPAFPAGLPEGTLFHPTFLYEFLWNAFGGVLLLLLQREFRLQWGKLFALYLVWYGAGRIWFESIRVDPSEVILGLRVNVWGAIVAVVLGIVLFLVQRRRHPGVEPGAYLAGREWTRPDAIESRYTAKDFEDDGTDAASPVPGAPATSTASRTAGSGRS